MRIRVSVLATAVAAGFAGASVLAVPAQADLSLHQSLNYRGGAYNTTNSNYTYHDGDTFNNGYRLHDAVSSLNNITSYTACFYTEHFYGGARSGYAPLVKTGYVGDSLNDKFSSHELVAGGC